MKIETILCPIDLDDASKTAFPVAVDLARTFGARLVLVHVVDDSFPYPEWFSFQGGGEDFYKAGRKEALAQMQRMVDAADVRDVETDQVVLQGRPAAEVVALAGERGADLIVLATHGRKGLDHALMGSQAVKILRNAPCPVFALRPEVEESGE